VQTLYDLLGALPDDDADELRAAFRNAVKASHPDNNPGDSDAPQRFRRIVRAHTILSDESQRAEYDSLLSEADQQRTLNSKRKVFSDVRHRVPGPVSSMVIASVSIGAFLLFERVLTISDVPAQVQSQVQSMAARASALTAAVWTKPSETVGLAAEHNKPDQTSVSDETEVRGTVKETMAPGAAEVADATGAIPATSEAAAVKDANYYRQRGSRAYRRGDWALALIDFDLAISLDPGFPDTYIDRAIVFHRMGDMKRALADVAQAKRIDDLKLQ
jgi:tetratricopeptide (TPR) repeat protein